MLARRGSWICAGVLALLIGVARGDHRYERYDCDSLVKQTAELRQHGHELSDAFRNTYRSTPQYGDLQANARDVNIHSGHLQALARAGADSDKLQHEARNLAQTYRLLVQNVREADLSFGAGYPGPAWLYRNPSRQNAEVQRLLACMDNTLRQIHVEVAKVNYPRNGQWDDHHHSQPGVYGQTGLTITNSRVNLHGKR